VSKARASRPAIPRPPPRDAAAEEAEAARALDAWVDPAAAAAAAAPKTARLAIDLPQDLHRRYKASCARRGVRMTDEVKAWIERALEEDGG